jgi:hypothetical protein
MYCTSKRKGVNSQQCTSISRANVKCWQSSSEMEICNAEQLLYVKEEVLQSRNALECCAELCEELDDRAELY